MMLSKKSKKYSSAIISSILWIILFLILSTHAVKIGWKIFDYIMIIINFLNLFASIFNLLSQIERDKQDEYTKNMNDFKKKMYEDQERYNQFFKSYQDYMNYIYGKRDHSQNTNNQYSYTQSFRGNLDINNAYSLMGLKLADDIPTIKRRYRELALKWHPDKWSTNTVENQKIANRNFQKLNNAYDIIKKHKNFV